MEGVTGQSQCFVATTKERGRPKNAPVVWEETTWAEIRARFAAQGIELKNPEDLYRRWQTLKDDNPA